MENYEDNLFEPELGQVVFSNSDYFEIEMSEELEDVIKVIGTILLNESKVEQHPCSNVGADGEYGNDVFAIRPYCWCEGERAGHDNFCLPNFEYKPLNLKCTWYKHLTRSATQNKEISPTELKEILVNCINSI